MQGSETTMTLKAPFVPGDISDWFWSVIDAAKRDPDILHHNLEQMTDEGIIRFALEFREAARYLNGEPHVTHLYSQDDEYAYDVACWVVSQGEKRYRTVWDHPESIVTDEEGDLDDVARHDLNGEAEHVLTERLAQHPWDGIPPGPEGDEIIQDLVEKFDDEPYYRMQDFLTSHQGILLETAWGIVKRERLMLASGQISLEDGEVPPAVRRMYESRRRPTNDAGSS
jgi:hypothetical protein